MAPAVARLGEGDVRRVLMAIGDARMAPMRVLVSGSHGLIGSALLPALRAAGLEPVRLVRHEPAAGDVSWDPEAGAIDGGALRGVDAVVHLAGVGIAERRWSPRQKERILRSRVDGTHLLSVSLAGLARRPRVMLSASAVGYYGDRGDEELTEESDPGDDFLAQVCRRWETATSPAEVAGIRVVRLRSGIVLSPEGGALRKQLPLFRLGLGGRLGSGRQWTSWISIADEVGAILHLLATEDLGGAVNLTAPNPVTNATFTAALGQVLHRPVPLRVPRLALQAAFGLEMARGALLAGQRARPATLLASGYRFRHSELAPALRELLGR